MSEWDFIGHMARESGCGLLLDVNNVYVSSFNHEFDPVEFVNNVPHENIVQCHLSGHSNCGTHIIDTHDDHVINPVWDLYRRMYRHTQGVSTLLEWDANIPAFEVLHDEVLKARRYMDDEPDVFGKGDVIDGQDEVSAGAGAGTFFHPLHHVEAEVE